MRPQFIRLQICLLIATAAIFMGGCSTIDIYSSPPGAMVIMNGNPTSYVTPAKVKYGDLEVGDYEFAVEMEGYKTFTPPQKTNVRLSKTEIIFSIFPWVLIKNLLGNHWKDYDSVQTFNLEKIPDSGGTQSLAAKQNVLPKQDETTASTGNPPTTKTVQSEVSALPAPELPNRKPITNADVVMMLKAKLSETTIVMAIMQGSSDFDTTPSSLVELRRQGATDSILEAIMQSKPEANQVKSRSNERGTASVSHENKISEKKKQSKKSPATTSKQTSSGGYAVEKTNKTDVIAKPTHAQNELTDPSQNIINSMGVNPELIGIAADGSEAKVVLTYGPFSRGDFSYSASNYIPVVGLFTGSTVTPLSIPGEISESKAPAKLKRILLDGYSQKQMADRGSIVVCVPKIDGGKRHLELYGVEIQDKYYKSLSGNVKLSQLPNGGWYFDIVKPLKRGHYIITFTNSPSGYWDFDIE